MSHTMQLLIALAVPSGVIATLLTLLLGENGLLERRRKVREGRATTHTQVAAAETAARAEDTGLIDRYREYVDMRMADATREIKKLADRVDQLERRDVAWAMYADDLRQHINDRLPPPPPAWPAGLGPIRYQTQED